jgi:NADPH-dependent ferric siderophore reductase
MAAEYVEARVLVPEDQIERFLGFCDEHLESMPAINRIPESADGHEVLDEIVEAAGREEPVRDEE